jgi:hypothetical protein
VLLLALSAPVAQTLSSERSLEVVIMGSVPVTRDPATGRPRPHRMPMVLSDHWVNAARRQVSDCPLQKVSAFTDALWTCLRSLWVGAATDTRGGAYMEGGSPHCEGREGKDLRESPRLG